MAKNKEKEAQLPRLPCFNGWLRNVIPFALPVS